MFIWNRILCNLPSSAGLEEPLLSELGESVCARSGVVSTLARDRSASLDGSQFRAVVYTFSAPCARPKPRRPSGQSRSAVSMAATIAVRSTSADVRDVASRSAGVQPPLSTRESTRSSSFLLIRRSPRCRNPLTRCFISKVDRHRRPSRGAGPHASRRADLLCQGLLMAVYEMADSLTDM